MEKTNKVRELTCIVCPRGCQLSVELCGAEVISVSGNICARGKKYAEDECIHPMRTLTTTVKTEDGGVVAVKTEKSIPKEQMFECMRAVNELVVPLPVKVGDVILNNVLGTRIVATQNKEE